MGSASAARERGGVEFATVQTMTPKEIRSRRLALGMSVEELARELCVASEGVREMENGERPVANARLLEQVFARRERDQEKRE
jgi:DNA-binding transcriptional regulator YiaG